jgi:hypothetical protein
MANRPARLRVSCCATATHKRHHFNVCVNSSVSLSKARAAGFSL